MKLGVVLYSNDPATIENALEFSSSGLREGDQVSIFLMGKGVEIESLSKTEAYSRRFFDIAGHMQAFVDGGGHIYSSSKCLTARQLENPSLCTPLTIGEIYKMAKLSDHIVTF